MCCLIEMDWFLKVLCINTLCFINKYNKYSAAQNMLCIGSGEKMAIWEQSGKIIYSRFFALKQSLLHQSYTNIFQLVSLLSLVQWIHCTAEWKWWSCWCQPQSLKGSDECTLSTETSKSGLWVWVYRAVRVFHNKCFKNKNCVICYISD